MRRIRRNTRRRSQSRCRSSPDPVGLMGLLSIAVFGCVVNPIPEERSCVGCHRAKRSAVVEADGGGEPAAGDPVEDESKPRLRRRILIADDNRDAADSLAIWLEIKGNETRVAYNGLEALEIGAVFKPDVIVLDVGMPMLNGLETCRRVRAEPWGARIVIVACTGWGHDKDRRNSREAGFDLHLVKPVDPTELERLLARLAPAGS